MVLPTRPPANKFVALARHIYNPIGFSKGYNFILWFILCGALIGFALARFMYLNFSGKLCGPNGVLPGECYFYETKKGKAGILLHLGAVLPAAFLVVFQFVPGIRHKFLILHRINGYVVMLLGVVSTVGVVIIARRSFAGGLDMQTASGAASIIFIGGQALAYYNIKRLQIEQHRAWMIRAWGTAGFTITMRIISVIMATIIGTGSGDYYSARPCAILNYISSGNQTMVESLYPACSAYYSGANPNQVVAIHADMTSGRQDEVMAAFTSSFGSASWIAVVLHLLLAELYLHLTPAEAERLRRVSYQRQLEAGMKNPGNAGLTVQRVGDAEPWTPKEIARDSEAVGDQAPLRKDAMSSTSDEAQSLH